MIETFKMNDDGSAFLNYCDDNIPNYFKSLEQLKFKDFRSLYYINYSILKEIQNTPIIPTYDRGYQDFLYIFSKINL